MKLLLANLLSFGRAANDIAISASTFEAFSTDFVVTAHAKNVPMPPQGQGVATTFNLDLLTMSGKMQFDVTAKKLKITSTLKSDATIGAMGAVNETASFTSLVDFAAWTESVHAKGSYTLMGMPKTYDKCIPSYPLPDKKASAAVSMYMNKQMLAGMAAMGSMKINMLPHTTADGVATFTKTANEPGGTDTFTIKIKTDGTPVSVAVSNSAHGSFSLTFSNWKQSSGDLTAPACTSTEDDVFDWNFVGLAEVTNFVREHPFVRDAADETTEMLVGMGDDNSDFSTLAAIFFVAGVAGAAVVMVMSKISAKKNKVSLLLDEV
jgi:hypothetical protein